MDTQPNQSAPSAAKFTLGEGPRTAISFVLFIHLFGLAFVVLGAGGNSQLVQRVRSVSSTHLAWLGMNHAHANPTVSGEKAQFDHFLEFEIEAPADKAGIRGRLGDGIDWPLERRQRFLAMANFVGQPIHFEAPEIEADVPQVIGGGLLRHYGAERLVLRCKLYLPQEGRHVTSSDALENDPRSTRFIETVYEAQIRILDGVPQVSKLTQVGPAAAPTSQPGTTAVPNKAPGKSTQPAADKPLEQPLKPYVPRNIFRND